MRAFVPCTNCSYYVLFQTTKYYFEKMGVKLDLSLHMLPHTQYYAITDTIAFLGMKRVNRDTIARVDSVLYADKEFLEQNKKDNVAIFPSEYNRMQYGRYFRASYTVYHQVHTDIVESIGNVSYKDRNISIISLGDDRRYDRKGVDMLHRLLKSISREKELVCYANKPYCFKQYSKEVADEYSKYRLLSRSKFINGLSSSETFGLTVAEGMATGTIPIYANCHSLKEIAVGIPVKCAYSTIMLIGDARYYVYIIDEKDALDNIKYALTMGKEEYEDLSEKVREVAKKRFNAYDISRQLLNIIKVNSSKLNSIVFT